MVAIVHGASDYCVSMVVQSQDTARALQQIHKLVVLNGYAQREGEVAAR